MERSFNPYPIVAVAKAICMALLFTAALLYLRPAMEDIFPTALVIVLLLCVAYVLLAFLMAKFHTITLEGQTIIYRSGILSLRKIVLPYAKITEASYTQGIVQRIFGVGTLRVDTAGGSQVAIYLADVRYSDLKKILDEINQRGGNDGGV